MSALTLIIQWRANTRKSLQVSFPGDVDKRWDKRGSDSGGEQKNE